jgi:hypothetical protein
LLISPSKYFPAEQETAATTEEKSSTPAKSAVASEPSASKVPAGWKSEQTTSTPAVEVAKKLPDTPQEEPTAKKFKAAHKALDDDDKDDDWVEIDKHSIPKQASVEEVEDEDDKKKY